MNKKRKQKLYNNNLEIWKKKKSCDHFLMDWLLFFLDEMVCLERSLELLGILDNDRFSRFERKLLILLFDVRDLIGDLERCFELLEVLFSLSDFGFFRKYSQ